MLDFYLAKLLLQGAWLLILIGTIISGRGNWRWHNIVQVMGVALLVFLSILDSVLWDPFIGFLRHTDSSLRLNWALWQRWVLSVGLLLFAVGFLLSSRGKKS